MTWPFVCKIPLLVRALGLKAARPSARGDRVSCIQHGHIRKYAQFFVMVKYNYKVWVEYDVRFLICPSECKRVKVFHVIVMCRVIIITVHTISNYSLTVNYARENINAQDLTRRGVQHLASTVFVYNIPYRRALGLAAALARAKVSLGYNYKQPHCCFCMDVVGDNRAARVGVEIHPLKLNFLLYSQIR